MYSPTFRRRFARWGPAALLAAASAATAVPAQAATLIPLPSTGQAALSLDGRDVISSPASTPQPIASVAKVMTAYQILLDHPLRPRDQGPTITVLASEAADYPVAKRNGETVIPVTAGERISERSALEAMLLPSANNMARILARWDAGSVSAFVTRANGSATWLGMSHTHYADPAGISSATVSTASDQLRLDEIAMANPVFAGIVGEKSATVPVAGTVYNSNRLLGSNGVVGVKTGWTTAAGSCLMFAAVKTERHGGKHLVYGVLLGQPGGPNSSAIDTTATRMVKAAQAAE